MSVDTAIALVIQGPDSPEEQPWIHTHTVPPTECLGEYNLKPSVGPLHTSRQEVPTPMTPLVSPQG